MILMNIRERLLTIRLLRLMDTNPDYAKKLGLEEVLKTNTSHDKGVQKE